MSQSCDRCCRNGKNKRGVVVPLTAGWSDIGSWEALSEKSLKDIEGNTLKGKTIIKNSNNCYIRSEERLIVGIGLTNLVVIETNDAILISDKNFTQKVKDVVIDLEKLNLKEGNIINKYTDLGVITPRFQ